MNFISIGIGVLALLFGVYTFFARKNSPEKFKKLEPMKKAYGEKWGFIIHFVGYTIIPIVIGVTFIVAGINGRSIF